MRPTDYYDLIGNGKSDARDRPSSPKSVRRRPSVLQRQGCVEGNAIVRDRGQPWGTVGNNKNEGFRGRRHMYRDDCGNDCLLFFGSPPTPYHTDHKLN